MNKIKIFLLQEIRKPIDFLGKSALILAKASMLFALRALLWGFLFLLPVLSILLFTFHSLTGRVREEWVKQELRPPQVSPPSRPQVTFSHASIFRALNQDVRFWQRELERLKKVSP